MDMNLDPLFLDNLLNKNEENNSAIIIRKTVECYTRFWHDISQLILRLYFHNGHRYGLRLPNPAKSLNKNEKQQLDLLAGRCWMPESSV